MGSWQDCQDVPGIETQGTQTKQCTPETTSFFLINLRLFVSWFFEQCQKKFETLLPFNFENQCNHWWHFWREKITFFTTFYPTSFRLFSLNSQCPFSIVTINFAENFAFRPFSINSRTNSRPFIEIRRELDKFSAFSPRWSENFALGFIVTITHSLTP